MIVSAIQQTRLEQPTNLIKKENNPSFQKDLPDLIAQPFECNGKPGFFKSALILYLLASTVAAIAAITATWLVPEYAIVNALKISNRNAGLIFLGSFGVLISNVLIARKVKGI